MDWIEGLYYFGNQESILTSKNKKATMRTFDNLAFHEKERCPAPLISFDDYAIDVVAWAKEKGLVVPDNAPKQFIKAVEEVSELAAVIMKNKGKEEAKKEIGDVFVTMIILAEQLDVSYSECLRVAFEKISKRTGETRDGIFVKSEDIR